MLLGNAKTKPGFAMMMVLILVAIGVVLGIAYLSVASLDLKVSQNFRSLARARYLAESGLEHALYTLRFFPEDIGSATLGPFHADETSDSYYITAEEVDGEAGTYLVTATAMVGEITTTSTVTVTRMPGTNIELEHSLLVEAGMVWLPWGLNVTGDIHVNGTLVNEAAIDGDASATAGISDLWWRITGEVDGNADAVEVPQFRVSDYVSYTIGTSDCTAAEFTESHLTFDDPLANGAAVTAANLAGVVYLNPDDGNSVVLHRNLNFAGTLVIEGDLVLDGRNITLTSVEGFPAVIVTGSIIVTRMARNVTINGVVVAQNGITPDAGGARNSSTTVNGSLICGLGAYDSGLLGSHNVNFNENASQLYNMGESAEERVPTVIMTEWHD